jgi:hypothetical protein
VWGVGCRALNVQKQGQGFGVWGTMFEMSLNVQCVVIKKAAREKESAQI